MYRVSLSAGAERELQKLPAVLVSRIISKLESLEIEPRPSGCKKLKGEAAKWRIRVGDYRVLYFIFDSTREVKVAAILNRKESYR